MVYLQSYNFDAFAWDETIKNTLTPHFMQSSAWGRFKSMTGWKSEYLRCVDQNQHLHTTLLLSKKFPGFNKRIFYIPRGPQLESKFNIYNTAFLNLLKTHVLNNNGIFIRADPYIEENNELEQIFLSEGYIKLNKKWSFWNAPKFVFWLDLPDTHEQLFSSFSTKIRTKIRYPYKKGVQFVQGSLDELKQFYALMVETARNKGIGCHGIAYYQKLYTTLQEGDMGQLFFAKKDGCYISTAMAVKYGCVAWLLYFASSRKHAALRPNHALVWEMLQWAIANGCTRFDFRGTATDDPPDPKNSGYGVYQFKKSFGPRFVRTIGYFDYVVHPLFYRMFRVAEDYCIPGLFECFAQGRKLKSHLFTK